MRISAAATRERYGFCGKPFSSPRSRPWARCSDAVTRSFRSRRISLIPTCMSAAPRRTASPGRVASARPTWRMRIASLMRPCARWMSAKLMEHPITSDRKPAFSRFAMASWYQRDAASRSAFDHDARASNAAAAARPIQSSSRTSSSAVRAWAIVPSTSPVSRASPARWMAIPAGRSRKAWSSTTIIPSAVPSRDAATHCPASSQGCLDALDFAPHQA